MEYIEGYSLLDKIRLEKDKISMCSVVKILNKTFARMIFEIGYLHSDPHPGNIFI